MFKIVISRSKKHIKVWKYTIIIIFIKNILIVGYASYYCETAFHMCHCKNVKRSGHITALLLFTSVAHAAGIL